MILFILYLIGSCIVLLKTTNYIARKGQIDIDNYFDFGTFIILSWIGLLVYYLSYGRQ